MTFLDKARSERKEKEIKFGEDGFPIGCPEDYGYENVRRGCSSDCEECWNREIPGTEPKPEIDAADYIDIYTEGYNKGHDEGMTDVWELALKYSRMSDSEREEIFNISNERFFFDSESMTPQEALAKLKAYEDSKIKVGDEVFCKALTEFDDRANKENYGVVTGIYSDHYEILMKNGDTTGFKLKECEKTGKHIDIQSILEQIRG